MILWNVIARSAVWLLTLTPHFCIIFQLKEPREPTRRGLRKEDGRERMIWLVIV